MSLMLKLSTAVLATTLLASAKFDLENYVRHDLIRNPQIKVNSVELIAKKDVPNLKDWKAYLFLMNLTIKNKADDYPETVLVNEKEGIVSLDLYDYKHHKKLADDLHPKLGEGYYNDAHLVAGKKDAKHKIVVFSDPMCPFCRKYVPDIYKSVKEHPDDFALYYYHMPLKRIHPVSGVLTRVMEVLQHKGKIEDAMKMYDLNIPLNETDENKVLKTVNEQLKVNVTKEEIDDKKIKDDIDSDVKKATRVMLRGTPTVYIDGKYDPDITSYKKLIKK